MASNNKFMVRLLSSVTPELLFAVGWLSIGLLFLAVVITHQKRINRRNFRGEGDGSHKAPDVTPRRLGQEQPSRPKKLQP